MAFNMKRPMIKGTPVHKASIAKARAESIVAQNRTQADSALVGAAQSMGKSYVPAAIDYTISSKQEYKSSGSETKKGGNKSKSNKETAAEKLRKKNLKKEYDKEHSGGTLFPNGKYYDADGNEVKQKKVKGEKTPTDNMFNDVNADGNVVSRLFGRARQAAQRKKAAQRKQAEIDAENLKKDKFNDKVKELKGYQKEKEAAEKKAQMAKTFDEPITTGAVVNAVGNQQMQQYTKEQKDRLKKEGVFSEDAGKIVLPEEIVDGEFVSKAEGTKLEPQELDYVDGKYVAKGSQDEKEVVEEEKVPKASSGKQRRLDLKYKLAGPSVRANMEADGYVPLESKSPMEMRDDRIYRNALSGGPIRKNMIKGGYTPK